jgi:hypothetical protein
MSVHYKPVLTGSITNAHAIISNPSVSQTWVFPENTLASIQTMLVERIQADDDLRIKIPVFGSIRGPQTTYFPYCVTIQSPGTQYY